LAVVTASFERLRGEIQIVEPTRIERALGRRTAEVRATVPDLEFGADADAAAALELAREHGCSLTAVLVRACALALREHPRANAAYRDGRFELYSRVNVAVTVQTDEGFVAPTLLDADAKPLEQLDDELESATARARAGALTPPELSGATFTLTDFGVYGITRATALIVPPQAAALAAGAPHRTHNTINLVLACDGRILIGAQGALFLARIAELLAQ
jgi:pyruvate dehydrogenase E2 component (dihydrolipoyllysine-residue acetyltransferase)